MADDRIRTIEHIVAGMAASDGAGVDLTRVIGTPMVDNIDPFLLLDEFRNDDPSGYVAGFPAHPHRGFETVTYMLQGKMRHKDSTGQSGLLTDGSVQWMTAGSGIIHSEMPEQTEGLLWGYQLWVNLPASLKMSPPKYQDIPPENIPEVDEQNGKVRVIAGEYEGQTGAAKTTTEICYLDVRRNPGADFEMALPDGWNGFVYLYQGDAEAAGPEGAPVRLKRSDMGIMAREGSIKLTAGNDGVCFLLLAGRPIGEPIARMGPFVMNTREELFKAGDDYRRGTLTDPQPADNP